MSCPHDHSLSDLNLALKVAFVKQSTGFPGGGGSPGRSGAGPYSHCRTFPVHMWPSRASLCSLWHPMLCFPTCWIPAGLGPTFHPTGIHTLLPTWHHGLATYFFCKSPLKDSAVQLCSFSTRRPCGTVSELYLSSDCIWEGEQANLPFSLPIQYRYHVLLLRSGCHFRAVTIPQMVPISAMVPHGLYVERPCDEMATSQRGFTEKVNDGGREEVWGQVRWEAGLMGTQQSGKLEKIDMEALQNPWSLS